MTDWYVSAAGAGSKDGTLGNAWDTFANIDWTGSGVQPGDDLYVIGTVTGQLTVGGSGSAGLPITIRGDADGEDAGIITSLTSANPLGAGDDWVVVPGRGTFAFQTVNLEPTAFYLNGTRLTFVEWTVDADTTAAVMDTIDNSFSVDVDNNIGYVHLEAEADPDTLGTASANWGVTRNYAHGVTMVDKRFITIKNLTIQKKTSQGVNITTSGNVLSSDIIIDNVTITSCGWNGIYFLNLTGNTYDMTGCAVRNCTISDCGWGAINTSFGIDGLVIENNTCRVCGWHRLANQIATGGSSATRYSKNVIIRNNISTGAISFPYAQSVLAGAEDKDQVDGNGIMLDQYSEDSITEHNICYDNQGYGIRVSNNSDGHTIRYNTCYGNGKLANDSANAAGIGAWDYDGIIIEYNTCYDNENGISLRKQDAGTSIVRHNIVSSSVAYDFRYDDSTVTAINFNNNCYYNAGVANNFYEINGTTAMDFASWQTQAGESSSIEADPKFTDAANADFSLQGNSPCLGLGAVSSPTTRGRGARYLGRRTRHS